MRLAPKPIREAAARDRSYCETCHDTGGVCEACMRRYEREAAQRQVPARG